MPSTGKAWEREGSKVLPLISQRGREALADRELPVAVGARRGGLDPVGQRPKLAGTLVVSVGPLADAELHQRPSKVCEASPPLPLRRQAQQPTRLPARWRKSRITSTRSPGPISAWRRLTGLGIRPLSVAIWVSLEPSESSRL